MARLPHERSFARGESAHRWPTRLARAALRGTSPALESRSVGNALLVHPRGFVDGRALTFTQRLAADPQHTLVVLDLPASPEDSVWETVARALDRRGRSFRLVPGRGAREDVNRAAQWLADRLERTVLAPDGAVMPAAGGALFVPAHHGAGWLLHRPNKPSVPDSRRFPKPQWEFSVPDQPRPTGTGGTIEPLPGGVWIRGGGQEPADDADRRRLVDLLAAHPQLLAVALGSPGRPALPLEEVAAFWRELPSSARPLVRFIPYGPVAVPDGTLLGQALADLLGQRVAVHTGIPVAGADGSLPEIRTLLRDGSLGWRPYADEFGFAPRAQTGGRPMAPVALNTRAPVGSAPAIGPGIYQYANDAVLEVVQSGLWVRPPTEPGDGHTVRSAPVHAPFPAILYDETDPASVDRMRSIAHELLRGLDLSFSRGSRVVPSGEAGRVPEAGSSPMAVTSHAPARSAPVLSAPGSADGWLTHAPTVEQPFPTAPDGDGSRALGPAAPMPALTAGPHGQEAGPRGGRHRRPALPPVSQPEPTHPAPVVPPTATPVRGPDLPEPLPLPGARATARTQPGEAPAAPVPPPAAPVPPPADPVSPPPVPVPSSAPPADPGAAVPPPSPGRPPGAPPAPAPRLEPPAAAPPGAPRIRLETSTPGPVPSPSPGPSPRPADGTGQRSAGGRPDPGPATAGRPEQAPVPGTTGLPRAQPEPSAAADVAPPKQGVERERDWLRRSLGTRYDSAVGFASRVLSESPGLHAGPRASAGDALTDLAAVRLYLSGATAVIDTAIRSGAPGPHVPLARCAAVGLRRLPSYRGAALLRATLSSRQRAWYAEGSVVTERSFLAALTMVRRGLAGTTDILVWSLTARRTALVVPEIPDRVLFPPGTRFKVLRVVDGDRPAVLLRELSESESDDTDRAGGERVPLDEIATAGLEQVHAFWKKAEQDPEVPMGDPLPEEHADAFRAAPGLLQAEPGGPPRPAVRSGNPPQKEGKP
ncbi:hypothetical protein ABZ845_21835 [Streptomyces sp. NPDC047022]|uniref:hypothetical protein n=1 Tax=Streptomyces sp. NPDC047022 TaxID=3155737 RepID=UPI0033F2EB90